MASLFKPQSRAAQLTDPTVGLLYRARIPRQRWITARFAVRFEAPPLVPGAPRLRELVHRVWNSRERALREQVCSVKHCETRLVCDDDRSILRKLATTKKCFKYYM